MLLKKNDASLLHSAYISNTMKTIQPHLSSVVIAQVYDELSKVRLPSQPIFLAYRLPENVNKSIKSIESIYCLPWVNGVIDLTLHLQQHLCLELAKQNGSIDQYQQLSWRIEPTFGVLYKKVKLQSLESV